MMMLGTQIRPSDFMIPASTHNEIGNHHENFIANVLAQSEALMRGQSASCAYFDMVYQGKSQEKAKELSKFKTFKGNRPSNMFLFKQIDPFALGMLIAAYEHKTFVEGVIWKINSFDQMGVELGKELALKILP